MSAIHNAAPEIVIDQRDPVVTLGRLATELTMNLSDPSERSLREACETIGSALDARLVTYRRIEDQTAHFVAGWAPNTPKLISLPLSVASEAHLPTRPLLRYEPIYLLPEPLELPVGLLDDTDAATLPRLVVPVLANGQVLGYLYLALEIDALIYDALDAMLTLIASLFHQTLQICGAGGDRRMRASMDRILRQTAIDFLELAPGEEAVAIDQAIDELGRTLGANHITYWDVDLTRGRAVRNHRWLAPDSDVPEILSEDPSEPNAAVTVFERLGEADLLDNIACTGVAEVVIDVGRHIILTPFVAPGRLGASLRGALVVSRESARPWTTWERDTISTFAGMIPQIRNRMETEAQVMASFYDAPVGIALLGDRSEVLDCNQSFLDFLGLEDERSILRTSLREVIAYEELTDEALDAIDAIDSSGETRGLELPYRHANGSVVWGRMATNQVPTGDGMTWLVHIEDVTALRAERERDRQRATQDALTGLPNRHELFDAISRRGTEPYTMLMLDLDGFKLINDKFGHLVGDELLATIGQRLSSAVRAGDLIGRFGGDEFVAILAGHHREPALTQHIERLRACILEPVDTSAGPVSVGVSIGAARNLEGDRAEAVMARADAAMYAEKQMRSQDEFCESMHEITDRAATLDGC